MTRFFSADNQRHWARLVTLCFLLALFCAGCSSKQAGLGGPGSLTPDTGGAPLTDSERAVLAKNKGKIARSVPDYAQPMVDQQTKYFLRNGRKTMAVISKRSERYLAYAKGVFRSYNMPEELAYLALVESGYNTEARSHAGAAGAWQFMPYTGMKFGLQQDNWQDERMDIYKATHAAARYLKGLYEDFNDWPTAIAAYNAGEGKMGRACKAAGERTFFGVVRKNDRLDEKTRLKEETRQYVPRFLAVAAIMENLGELGFEPLDPRNQRQVTRVTLAPGTDLKAMARACSMSWTDFQSYNPHFRKNISHAKRSTNAYVPVWAGERAVAYARKPVRVSKTMLAAASGSSRTKADRTMAGVRGTRSYTLRSGDTLSSVARAHNTSVAALLAANSLSDPHSLHVGQKLTIPGTDVASASGNARKSSARRGASSYKVQPKDNLWQISRKLNVSVDDLKRWNNLEGQNIHVGQRLVVLR